MSTFVIRFSGTPQFRYVIDGSGSPTGGDVPDAASLMRFLVSAVSQVSDLNGNDGN